MRLKAARYLSCFTLCQSLFIPLPFISSLASTSEKIEKMDDQRDSPPAYDEKVADPLRKLEDPVIKPGESYPLYPSSRMLTRHHRRYFHREASSSPRTSQRLPTSYPTHKLTLRFQRHRHPLKTRMHTLHPPQHQSPVLRMRSRSMQQLR